MVLVSTEAMQKFISYIDQNKTMSVSVSNYVLSIFDNYICLSIRSDYKQTHLEDLFESAFIDKNSRSVNQVKKELKSISNLLDQAHKLIHSTHGGKLLFKNKKSRDSIKSLQSLSSLAEHENSLIEFQKGRGKSQERIARLDMLSKLMFLAEYYGVSNTTTQTGEFYALIESIYKILKISVNNLNSDMSESRTQHTNEKDKNRINFEFMGLKKEESITKTSF